VAVSELSIRRIFQSSCYETFNSLCATTLSLAARAGRPTWEIDSMKTLLSLMVGLMTGVLAVLWITSEPTDSGFSGAFVRPVVLGLAGLLFRSPEAAFLLAWPVVLLYGGLFGLGAGLACRLVLSLVITSRRPRNRNQ